MVWGGSLNKDGSDYIRKLREADRVITFLESLKEELNTEEQANFSRTIEIIVEYISKISEKKE
ncbi:MAG: hypothetical protein E3J52_09875 [Promethearchaeota archaeon]|nr:MAG: hypothetical protein E3J52_09875 [Candidatus Lokiarchaeota archaeon]